MSNSIKETVAKLKKIGEGHLGAMADRVELDHEVQLARGQLYKIAKYAIKLHEAFKDVNEVQGLDGWVSAKITEASLAMDDVAHYMEYELSPANVANEEIEHKRLEEEEGTAADLLHKYKINEDDKGYTSMQDLIDRLNVDGDTDDDPGLERDKTKPLDQNFSDNVVTANEKAKLDTFKKFKKARTSQGSIGTNTSGGLPTPESKYKDWSK